MHVKAPSRLRRLLASEQRIHTRSQKPLSRGAGVFWSVVVVVGGIGLVIAFLHFDRNGQLSAAMRSWGGVGVVVSVLLMGLFCVIPVPSEFLMVMNMKVYGVWWGIFYSWSGAMVGATVVFFMARHMGSRLLQAFVSEARLSQVESWVQRRGVWGLLLARLVPLPFIVVNYAAGVIRSVRVWDYVWTTGVGLLPYDVGAALVFLGFSKRFLIWLIIGGVAIVGFWIGGFVVNRHVRRAQRWAH